MTQIFELEVTRSINLIIFLYCSNLAILSVTLGSSAIVHIFTTKQFIALPGVALAILIGYFGVKLWFETRIEMIHEGVPQARLLVGAVGLWIMSLYPLKTFIFGMLRS